MRKTLVVHNRFAWRSYRTRAALGAEQGLQLFTIDQMAARLAGGFQQPVDQEDFKAAVAAALTGPLGELEVIKTLPGFQRAAAASLAKAWSAALLSVRKQNPPVHLRLKRGLRRWRRLKKRSWPACLRASADRLISSLRLCGV